MSHFIDTAMLQTLIKLLRQYTHQTIVALALCSLIRTISGNAGLAKELAENHDALPALRAVKSAHKDDDRLMKEAESAWRRLEDAFKGVDDDARNSMAAEAGKTKLPGGAKAKSVVPGSLKGQVETKLKNGGKNGKTAQV
uniref:Uncharacterized protein n=2 Tax=Haptolina brevifila TaxID=156173 RepID=A0A7S2IYT0_9EUKA